MSIIRSISRLIAFLIISQSISAQTADRIYLTGKGPSDAIEWEFFCTGGRKSGEWTTIPVPSNWEQHGFGAYDYGHVPPDQKQSESGIYRTTFFAPEDWKNNYIRIVFEGSMTETSIKLNGIPVGTPHQGGYLPFSYSINSPNAYANNALKYGKTNILEVEVSKRPSNPSLDIAERKADYWVFGGIYRPVYIEVLPRIFINRLAINADSDGTIKVDVFPQAHRPMKFRGIPEAYVDEVEAQVVDQHGEPVGDAFSAPLAGATGRVRLSTCIPGISPWSPEFPHLYTLRVRLKNKEKTISEKAEIFGFRTFEKRTGDGFYLNGSKLKIKGVNRNGFDPNNARALDPERDLQDALMIKEMNANLVRSHLPPTKAFMEACDSLGLLVISELTNWQRPHIDPTVARNLVYSLVTFYQNHPSVILWANGNEGGFNAEIDELYHLYDLQDRPVILPWSVFEGIDTKHYPSYKELLQKAKGNIIYLPTEFLHGLYDGGHGAGLNDYWSLMEKTPTFAGGVLWCWGDAALSRTDRDGRLDTDGNHSADGIVGPNGEKEASYFTIREIWSPVKIIQDRLDAEFHGCLSVKNNYLFTSLDQCSFEWKILQFEKGQSKYFEKVIHQDKISGPGLGPGMTGELRLNLPADWNKFDALVVKAFDANEMEVMEWAWPISSHQYQGMPEDDQNPKLINGSIVQVGKSTWKFNKQTGQLTGLEYDGESVGLFGGPALYAGKESGASKAGDNWSVDFIQEDGRIVVSSTHNTDGSFFTWVISGDEKADLKYSFAGIKDSLTYCAVGFDLPEESVESKQWLGKGPYRVWGNRMQGPRFGLWENTNNNTIPGCTYDYPSFKGVFADVEWMTIFFTSDLKLTLNPDKHTHIGVLRPDNVKVPTDPDKNDKKSGPRNAVWDYPQKGGLFIFHKVPAVGTKFKPAEALGPEGMRSSAPAIEGALQFELSKVNSDLQ